jgi:hypothetical protein
MTRENTLLKLIAHDLRSLHASALVLEKNVARLAMELESQDLASLAGLIAQINCSGFDPIEDLLRRARIQEPKGGTPADPLLKGALMDAAGGRRLDVAGVIGMLRRSARYLEMHCMSLATSATQLGLTQTSHYLRAWAREWIGLELNLNAVAARPRPRESPVAVAATAAFAMA